MPNLFLYFCLDKNIHAADNETDQCTQAHHVVQLVLDDGQQQVF